MSSKYGQVHDNNILLSIPSTQHHLSISINININIRISEDDPSHEDHHQEPQEDGGFPQSIGRFLTTIFHLTPPQLSINI